MVDNAPWGLDGQSSPLNSSVMVQIWPQGSRGAVFTSFSLSGIVFASLWFEIKECFYKVFKPDLLAVCSIHPAVDLFVLLVMLVFFFTADVMHSHSIMFSDHSGPSSPASIPAFRGTRRASETSIASQVSGLADSYTASNIANSEFTHTKHTTNININNKHLLTL